MKSIMRSPWLLAGLAALILIQLAGASALRFVCDDAYIAFRYSDNLARHGQLVYNLGERVEGYTSLLWVLLMAAGIKLGMPPEQLSCVAGIAAGAGVLLVLLAWLAQRHAGRALPIWAGVAAAALAVPLWAWSTGGLETTTFTLLLLLGAWQTLGAQPRLQGGLWLGLAALTRPEGILAIGVLGAWLAVRAALGWVDWRKAAIWLLPAMGIVLGHVAWRYWYYGELVPNTYYVKGPMLDALPWGGAYLASFIGAHPLALLGVAGLVFGAWRRDATLAAVLTLVLVYTAHVVAAGGDFMDLGRFFVPLVPLLALGVAELARLMRHRRPAMICVGLVLALQVSAGTGRVARTLDPWSPHGIDSLARSTQLARNWVALGRWLAREVKPGESMMTTAAGALPYHAGCYTVDQLGLVSREIARTAPLRSSRPGHRKMAPLEYGATLDVNYLVDHPMQLGEPWRGANPKLLAAGYVFRCVYVPECDPGAQYWGFYYKPLPGDAPD